MKKIRVNGTEYDGSIILKVAGEEFSGPEEISYDDKIERAKTYGLQKSRRPRGRTKGKYTPGDPTMKGPKKGMMEIRNKLSQLGGGVISKPVFQVTVSYLDQDGFSTTDVIEDVQLAGIKAGGNATSAEAAMEEWTLDTMGIRYSGTQTLYEQF